MPINYALLLCIPIGLLFYFGAVGLLHFFLGRYEQKDRAAAYLFAAFGALSIPLIYCTGILGDTIPGQYGRTIAGGLFGLIAVLLIGPLLRKLIEEKWRTVGKNH